MICTKFLLCHLQTLLAKLLVHCSITIHPKNRISVATVLPSGMRVLCIRISFTIVTDIGTTAGRGTIIANDIGTTAGNGTIAGKNILIDTIIKIAAMSVCTKHPLTPSVAFA